MEDAHAFGLSSDEVDEPETENSGQLSEESLSRVNSAVLLNTQYLEKRSLLNNGLIYRLNALNLRTLHMDYIVDTNSDEDAVMLGTAYHNYLNSLDVQEVLAEYYGISKSIYVMGMLDSSVTKVETGMTKVLLYVDVYLFEEDDAATMTQLITDTLQAYAEGNALNIAQHTLTLEDSYENQTMNDTLLEQQHSLQTNVEKWRTNVSTAVAELSEEELEEYYRQIGKTAIEEEEEEEEEEESNPVAFLTGDQLDILNAQYIPPVFSVKYFLIGIFGGIVLYVGIYFVIMMLRPRLISAAQFSEVFGVRNLGEVRTVPYVQGWRKLFFSKRLYCTLYKEGRNTQERIREIIARRELLQPDPSVTITLLLPAFSASRTRICEEIIDQEHTGLTLIKLEEGNVMAVEQVLKEAESAIVFGGMHATDYGTLRKLAELCNAYQVEILGTVAVEG